MKIANSLIRLFYTLMNRRIPKQNTIKQDTSIDRTMHYMNIGINNENMFTIVLNEIEKSIAEKIVSIKNAIFLVLAAVVAMLCCLIAEVKNLNNIGVVVIVVASAVSGISLFATCGTRAYYSPNKKKQKKRKKGIRGNIDEANISNIEKYWSLPFEEFISKIIHLVEEQYSKDQNCPTMTEEQRIRAIFIHQQLCEFYTKKRGVKIAVGCLIVALVLLIIVSVLSFCGIDLSYSNIRSIIRNSV